MKQYSRSTTSKILVSIAVLAGITILAFSGSARADIVWTVGFGSQSGQVVTDGTAGASVAPGIYNVQSVLFNATDGKTIDMVLGGGDITWDGSSVTDVILAGDYTLALRNTVFDRQMNLEASGLTSTYVYSSAGTIDSGATTWTPEVIPPANANLLMYFDFNSESGGIVSDQSGYGQDGDLNGVGATTLTADGGGHSGQAGDKALSYSSTHQATDLNYFVATSTQSPGAGDWSVSFWYKTDTTSGGHPLVDHTQIPDNTSGYQMTASPAGGDLSIWDDDGSNHLAGGQGLTLNGDGNWHHIAFSVDRTNDTCKVYTDGAETDSFSVSNLHSMSFGQIHIGTYNNGQALGGGEIDDYAIFVIALTPTEVAALANRSLTPDKAGLGLPTLITPSTTANFVDGATVQIQLRLADADAVTLVWAESDQGESDITTWQNATGGGSQALGAATAGTTLTNTITGRPADTEFFYRFFATNSFGNGWSEAGTFTTGITLSPYNLVATAVTAVDLSWTDSFSTETGFQIQRSTDLAFGTFDAFAAPANATGFYDTNVVRQTTYYYRVAADGSTGTGPFSAAVKVTTGAVLAYWDFNSESGGIVSDQSGYGQDGDLNGVGATTLTADGGGHSGQAGDKALSYSSTHQATDLNYFVATSTQSPGAGDWSVSFWYKTDTTSGGHPLVDHTQIPDNTSGYQMNASPAGGDLSIWDDDGSNHLAGGQGLTLNGDENWHHIAFSVDRTNDTCKVYTDGAETDSFSVSNLHSMTFGQIHIGTYNNGQTLGGGEIDDYAIYAIALTPTEVAGLANRSLTPDNLVSPFVQWAASFGLGGTNAAFNADADGDGGKNGYEWATGTNPTNPASITMLGIGIVSTDAVVSFTRNTNATDVAIYLQRSTNLVSNVWNGIATNTAGSWSPAGIVTETGAGNPVDVEITNSHTNHPAAFYRLLVE